MVLSEQQKKDLIERLKKGRETAKEKKLNEANKQVELKSTKSSKSKKVVKEVVNDVESASESDTSIEHDDTPIVKKESKKVEPKKESKPSQVALPLEEAFDQMNVKSKPIDIPQSKKEKPYLKIKLYKEPANPNLINKFVNSINETEETATIKKNKEPETTKSIEPEKSEREKHLERLCRLYFN